MNLKPEVVEQLERVFSSVEQLLPKAIEPIDWRETPAANWRSQPVLCIQDVYRFV